MNDPEIIEFNVGGSIFATTNETLKNLELDKTHFFANNANKIKSIKIIYDKHNRVFLDREPQVFKEVLTHVRALPSLPLLPIYSISDIIYRIRSKYGDGCNAWDIYLELWAVYINKKNN